MGANFVTQGNLASGPNAISISAATLSASASPADYIDFIFSAPRLSAGLFVGNIGNFSNSVFTLIAFLDVNGATIASELIDQTHAGMIFGGTAPFDNRIFYGITSDIGIASVIVRNGPSDGDGIVIDDVQFAATVPEPSSLLLGVLGLIGLAAQRRSYRPG